MPDNFIDDLAKGNLENFKPQYNAADWNAMEKLLDEKPVAQVPFWKSGAMMMAASCVLLLTGGIAGYYLGYFTGSNSNIPNPSYSLDFPAPVKSSDLNITPGTTDEIIVPPAVSPVYEHNTMASNKSDFIESDEFEISQEEEIIVSNEYSLSKLNSLSAGLIDGNEVKLKMKRNMIITSEESFKPRFSAGLSFAPDMNFPDKTRGGFTAGLTAEARISERFALISGINYTEKSYEDTPAKSLSDMITSANPLKTTATFKMLEVPLLLKYYLGTKSRVKPFVTAGVSNYFPIVENYEVQCTVEKTIIDPNNPYSGGVITTTENSEFSLVANSYSGGVAGDNIKSTSSSPTVESLTNYNLKPYLGFINIGGGVRYDITPAVSVQMNPQMKLPVAGIGLEEKMMSTLSFNTTVLYNFR